MACDDSPARVMIVQRMESERVAARNTQRRSVVDFGRAEEVHSIVGFAVAAASADFRVPGWAAAFARLGRNETRRHPLLHHREKWVSRGRSRKMWKSCSCVERVVLACLLHANPEGKASEPSAACRVSSAAVMRWAAAYLSAAQAHAGSTCKTATCISTRHTCSPPLRSQSCRHHHHRSRLFVSQRSRTTNALGYFVFPILAPHCTTNSIKGTVTHAFRESPTHQTELVD